MASFNDSYLAEQLIRECIETQNPFLDLGNCGLHNKSFELDMLVKCRHITHLNLGAGYFAKKKYQKSANEGRKNGLNFIPAVINKLENLEELYLSENQLGKISNIEILKRLSILQLQNNVLMFIDGLSRLPNLIELNLGNNQIQKISGLEHLQNLDELLLYNNKINRIEGLESLINLTNLNLSFNNISKIEGVDTLTSLKDLILANNKISKIENINPLIQLRRLNLSSNQINRIEGLEDNKLLEFLWLNHNQVSTIEGLSSLSNLKDLQLNNNSITSIDNIDISLLEQLEEIDLSNNSIEGVSIRDWTNKEVILGYLRAKEQEKFSVKTEEVFIPNKYIKLNIIGDGRIGKTQLLNVLCEEDFEDNAPETHGMNHSFYHTQNKEATAIIWDFGGQSYHHGTHALFLREKDFYLALWRNVPDAANYSYWLGTARHFTGYKFYGENEKPVPLMLVQNVWQDMDDVIATPDNGKTADYGVSFADIHFVNVKERNGSSFWQRQWNYFRAYLDEQITAYAKSYGDIPKAFNDVREKVIFKGINISKEKFKKEFAPEIADEQYEYLLDYLEYAGCILYFSKIEGLKDYIFPNPVYLSEWIYNEVLQNEGEKIQGFTKSELAGKQLDEQEIESFMHLAEYFKLTFKSPFPKGGEDYYIVPQHLPDNNTVFKEVLFRLLPFTFCLYYPDFMHEGRIFEFHALYGKYAKNETAYWKYGILFTHESTELETLVYFDKANKAIKVHIQEGKNISTVAREIFDFFAYGNELSGYNEKQLRIMSQKYISPESQSELDKVEIGRKKLLPYIQISTDGRHFIDIGEAKESLKNKTPFAMCKRNHRQIKLDFITMNLLSENSGDTVRVFISYSHKDEQYKDELDRHFTMLKRSGIIETWHDRKIMAGDEWDESIKKQLEEADIVLLMLSADFLASEYIWNEELKIIEERIKRNDGLTVIPIPVRSCHLEGFEFMKNQSAVRDEKGNVPWLAAPGADKDSIYTKIVTEVEKALKR